MTSSSIYHTPQLDMDLYQQNDSGIVVVGSTAASSGGGVIGGSTTTTPPTTTATSMATTPTTTGASGGNLKPPKTPSRMYSRDRSNHSLSVVYPSVAASIAGVTPPAKEHLSRRSISNNAPMLISNVTITLSLFRSHSSLYLSLCLYLITHMMQ